MFRKTKKIIIYSGLLIIAIALLIWWTFFNFTRARDYQRLGDMRILESAFNSYFFKFNTYQIPECSAGSVINFCTGQNKQILDVSQIIDPVSDGNLRYVIASLADDNFKVEFYLESSLAGLPSGQYALTKEGLGK